MKTDLWDMRHPVDIIWYAGIMLPFFEAMRPIWATCSYLLESCWHYFYTVNSCIYGQLYGRYGQWPWSPVPVSVSEPIIRVGDWPVASSASGHWAFDHNTDPTILWSSGEGQARIGKGWPLRRKASKLKPEPRAYIKVGCHHHPPTTTTTKRLILLN